MHAIVKVVGVTPEAIAKLHTVLKQPNLQTQEEHCQPNWGPDTTHIAGSKMKVPYVKLMDSKLHPDSGTYTVTLRLNLVIRSYRDGEDTSVEQEGTPLVFPPLSAFSEVFKSIDPRLLPETETTRNKASLPGLPNMVLHELVEKLSPVLGKKSAHDISDSNTGGVIIPCQRKITRTLIRKLAESIKNLDFDNGNDSVICVLKRVRDEFLNEFESLVEKVRGQFSEAQIRIDSPEKPKGNHWLDIKNGEKSVTVEWRPTQGFGFYAADAGYGEGPEEIIPDKDKAFEKVVTRLKS